MDTHSQSAKRPEVRFWEITNTVSQRSRTVSHGIANDMFRYRATWDVAFESINQVEFGLAETWRTALDHRTGFFAPETDSSGRNRQFSDMTNRQSAYPRAAFTRE